MEKKDFLKIVKDRLKKEGFRTKGNEAYKILDEDYLIGVSLDHHPFCKGYYIYYGVLYLPDDSRFIPEKNFPFSGLYDWHDIFIFTKEDSNVDLKDFQIENMEYLHEELIDYYEYDLRTCEELTEQLEINIQEKLKPLKDKTYAFKYYKNHLDDFIYQPIQTIEKLLDLYDFDREEVYRKRKAWETMYD